MKAKLKSALALVAASTVAATASAQAAGPDMTGLTSAVDFGTVTTAIMSIAGLLAVVYVAIKGARIGLSMIKR